MRRCINRWITLLVLLLSFSAKVNAVGDSTIVSLLTCSPGTELYSMFGHSGIRVNNLTRDYDVVYNYGMFNYDAENFAWKFVLGHTDYELGAEYTDNFFQRYERKGCGVVEQVLNLTEKQKNIILTLLKQNYLPENRVYRYNFLYDNCTTRARDLIERTLTDNYNDGHIVYAPVIEQTTFRDMIHRYTSGSPWVEFGIDLLLGSEVDKPLSMRESMFLPAAYEQFLDSAAVEDAGQVVEVTEGKYLVVRQYSANRVKSGLPLPTTVFWGVFFVGMLFVYLDLQRGKILLLFDVFMMTVQGLVGIVLTFMMLFSEHPAVGSNWLVCIFNPLVFYVLYRMLKYKGKSDKITTIYAGWMLLFLLAMMIIPQTFNDAILPIVLIMTIRTCTYEYVARYGALEWLSIK